MRNNMLRRLLILGFIVIVALSFYAFSYIGVPEAKKGVVSLSKGAKVDYDTWIDINNVRMVTSNRGSIAWDVVTGNAGLEYPKGTGKLAIFAAGIWMGGMVGSNLRYILCDYDFEWFPGNITSLPGESPTTFVDGTQARWQVFKLTKGDGPENPDYAGWIEMAPFGAPMNDDGTPAIMGDQTLWTIFNDADPSVHEFFDTRPLNIECKETVFAFDKSGALGNTVFVRLDFTNKGPDTIEDYYCSFWSDPDLGDAFNDVVGCDPEIGLGFCYNADNVDGVYVGEGACVGYDFFQGVKDDAGNILGMTSFNKYINGTDPRTAQEAYSYQQGLTAAGAPLIDPTTGNVTKYYCNGDPVTNSGWIDSAPADRRLMCNTGPTTLNPGDENTVVVALVLGSGKERMGAVSGVRYYDIFAQGAFDVNFEIPPDPPTPNVTVVTLADHFYISWQDNAEDYSASGYDFEGYNVYTTNKPAATLKSDWKRLDTFDVAANGITKVFGITLDEETGLLLESPVQFGSDVGIKRFTKITSDEWSGGGAYLIAQKEYYYAVTAYAYNPIGAPKDLESVFNQITIIPKLALPGTDYSGVAPGTLTEATHDIGMGSGDVKISVVNPQFVTGQSYKVTFTDMGDGTVTWNLLAGSVSKISQHTNFTGDWNYPFVDGLIVRLKGVNAAPVQWSCGSYVDPDPETIPEGVDAPFYLYFRDIAHHTWAEDIADPSPGIMGRDVEIRTKGEGLGQVATAINGSASTGGWTVDQNYTTSIEFWDLEDPEGEKQINFCWWDRGENGAITPSDYDRIMLVHTPYDANGTHTPADPLATWYFSIYDDCFTAGMVGLLPFDNALVEGEDEFSFTSTAPVVGNETIAKDAFFKKIRIVPNPYYGFSLFERTRFQRIMLFTNLPQKCTIRIFDLGGTLIRTIEKDSQDPTYRWDMLTDFQLPLGSGVYIAHIESKYGSIILKLAVFTEQETLETY